MDFRQALKLPKALCYFKQLRKPFAILNTTESRDFSLEILRILLFCFCFHLEFLKFNPPRHYFIVFIASPETVLKF